MPASQPTSSPTPDDAHELALLGQIRQAGPADRRAWAELVHRYQDRLFAVCFRLVGNRETAADLTQDSFVKIIQGLETYDGRSKLSTWMIRVAMNVCLSHLRAQKLRKHASLDAMGGGVASSLVRGGDSAEDIRLVTGSRTPNAPHRGVTSAIREQTPASNVQQGAQRRIVAQALAGLEPDQRAILILRDVQGLEYDQIAAALEVPGGTVKSRLFRARLALREAIERLEGTHAKPGND
ncbi:MAG: RNA polymerase sigma factor [Phycisphaerales bacterium]|nr:RNA polymerase sigma factor [Phycisphaerales bacterium]